MKVSGELIDDGYNACAAISLCHAVLISDMPAEQVASDCGRVLEVTLPLIESLVAKLERIRAEQMEEEKAAANRPS